MKAQVCNAVHKTMTARSGRRFCGEAILRKCLCSDWAGPGQLWSDMVKKILLAGLILRPFALYTHGFISSIPCV